MTHHYHLAATPDTVHWGTWSARHAPVLTVPPNSTVVIDTLSGGWEHLPPNNMACTVLAEHITVLEQVQKGAGPHLLTGPICIETAQPGDILQVDIIDITLRQDWGWNRQLPLQGALPSAKIKSRCIHAHIDTRTGDVSLPWGQTFAARPFFGCVGVAPDEDYGVLSSVEPRAFGGNIDNREMVAGTSVQLPVFVAGAHFSVGDGHALQGDGEVCLTALETALTGKFRFKLIKNTSLARPRLFTQDSVITMGFDEDLDTAARIALQDMIDLLTFISELTAQDAYTLCSLAAHLRITQMVNGQKGVHCVFYHQDLPCHGKNLAKLIV